MNLLEIPGNKNLKIKFSGMDCFELCIDKKHFENYKKTIFYEYNSNGFRDKEWPLDLKNRIWCLGDSFTAGIGQPQEEIWPALLEKQLGERCINISEDGCSNDLISLRVEQIKKFDPKCIIIMWSYFWRRWINNKNVHFHKDQRESPKDDLDNFLKNLQLANSSSPCNVLNYVIPDCMIESKSTWKHMLGMKNKKNINRLIDYHYPKNQFPVINEIEQIDYARDGHHFDVLTCERIVADILTKY